ncbi:hypothetical protein ACWIGX_38815 [Streptomyces nigrescens]
MHGRTAEDAQAATDKLIAAAGIDAGQVYGVTAYFTCLEEVEALARRSWPSTPI